MHIVHVGWCSDMSPCPLISVRPCSNSVLFLSGTSQRVFSYLVYTSTCNLVTFRGLTWLTGLEPRKNLICTSYPSPFWRSWAELAALSIVYHCMRNNLSVPFRLPPGHSCRYVPHSNVQKASWHSITYNILIGSDWFIGILILAN